MDIARHLALIDALCSRPFPAGPGPTPFGTGGPGRHVAVLESSHGLRAGDAALRPAAVRRCEDAREAVRDRLDARWGEAPPWNLQTVLLRTEWEEIPEPWAELSARARVAGLWEAAGTDRWVAVAVADRDEADEVQLLAVVTTTAPP
ncbi:hypothetical protein AAH978_20630 [Streptomyces sp. ZYX-F-203]